MSWWKKLFKKNETTKTIDTGPEEDSDIAYIAKKEYDKPVDDVLSDPPAVSEIVYPTTADHDTLESFYKSQSITIYQDIKSLDLMKVKFEAAANQSRRRDKVRGICLHHIMMGSFRKNVDFLKSKESGVSAHYCLSRNGELVQMVNTKKKAWHSGVSEYVIGGVLRNNLNNCLIGIEIVNPGVVMKDSNGNYTYNCGGRNTQWTGTEPVMAQITYPSGKVLEAYSVPYTDKQINKLVALCKALVKKYPHITRDDIVAHYQIAQPGGRKNDPFGLDMEMIKNLIFRG